MSDGITGRLDAILAAVGELRTDVNRIQSDVDGLKSDVDGLKLGVNGLKADLLATRSDIMARVDRVQDALTEQRDDLTVMLGLIDGVQRIGERALSESRTNFDQQSRAISLTATLERQIRRLQDEVRQLRGEAQ